MKYLIVAISAFILFMMLIFVKPYVLGEELILNLDDADKPDGDSSQIASQLKEAVNDIKAKHYTPDGRVDYKSIRDSAEFKQYLDLTKQLRGFDLASLETRPQKLAFWINIYNSLVVHGIIATGVKQNVWEHKTFFKSVKYIIGGHKFSLDDIEHGILRANRGHSLWRKPFSDGDLRVKFALKKLDPRIHFTLVCGAKSCPPIGIYDEELIEEQLDLASRSFVNSEVEIYRPEELIVMSKIFDWYAKDFGKSRKDRLKFLIRYLNSEEKREFLERNMDEIKLSYRPYDWSLNR